MFTICLPGDVDEAAAVLSDAFTGDPLFEFMFPDPDRHPGQVGRFAAITARRGIANGHGYTYVDDDRILGVAMWSPPGRTMPARTRASTTSSMKTKSRVLRPSP